ncbi:MAG: anti-sigma factor [Acidimicrobiia bacterium]|nr:anti-sigma factor [Acidimicrobiia bacterium]
MDLSHEEIEALLGVYALDAVEGEEREAVELHLRECPRCRAEVAEHREVAALIAHGGAPAPAGVWDKILSSLEEPPPQMRLEVGPEGGTVVPLEPRPSRSRLSRLQVALLGTAAAIILVLGVAVVRLDQRLSTMDHRATASQVATAALVDPSSRRGTLELHDGSVVPTAITRDGSGFLLAGSTPSLRDGLVYQLWRMDGSKAVSLGTFDGRSAVVPFHVGAGTTTLAVTEEQAPGATRPTAAPIGQIRI